MVKNCVILQPSSCKTDDEIDTEVSAIIDTVQKRFDGHYSFEVEAIEHEDDLNRFSDIVGTIRFADLVYFASYWSEYTSCNLLYRVCVEYNINVLVDAH